MVRYQKGPEISSLNTPTNSGRGLFYSVARGLLTFHDEPLADDGIRFEELFDVKVGIAAKQAFRDEVVGTLEVLKGRDDVHKFVAGFKPRNQEFIVTNFAKPCIYVLNRTRRLEVAFRGNLQYFDNMLCLVPKSDMDDAMMDAVVTYLNSDKFKINYTDCGKFVIGQREMALARLVIMDHEDV